MTEQYKLECLQAQIRSMAKSHKNAIDNKDTEINRLKERILELEGTSCRHE
jgi:hypothetical protein